MTIRSLSRTVLEALVAANCQNNGRQALPLLVRPRFLPRNQKGPGSRVYRPAERSELLKATKKLVGQTVEAVCLSKRIYKEWQRKTH